jgi:protein SCO1
LTTKRSDLRFILLAVAVAALSAAAGIGLWRLNQAGPPSDFASLLVLPEPRVLGDFSLVDQDGKPFLERASARPLVADFLRLHVLPRHLSQHAVRPAAGQPGRCRGGGKTAAHQVIFVSVDPERDSPERLREYVSWFSPDFVGVTGASEQLAPLALRIGVAYRVEEHAPGSLDYAVDHSASVFLTDPQGRLRGVFPAPHEAGAMARDLAALLE